MLQEVVPSFAVAKVYQIPNTNQILTRKTSQNIHLSCTHFPLNKTLTTTEKILCRRCNIPPLPLGIALKFVPKSSVSLRFHLHPHPKGTPRPTPKGAPRQRLKGGDRPTPPCFSPSPPLLLPELSPPSFPRHTPRSNEAGIPSQPKRPNRGPENALHKRAKTIISRAHLRSYREPTCDLTESPLAIIPRA